LSGAHEILSDEDNSVLKGLRGHGDAWIVGGWVRDFLSGSTLGDLDIATTLKPSEVKEIFPRSLMFAEKYGTVTVRLDGAEEKMWDVTTLRSDGGYGDGRRPDNVEFGENILSDLARRDFTINSLAIDEDGKIIDPFGGIDDLGLKILRAVGDASERISEDGLRIMRAFRFLDSGESGIRTFDESLLEAIKSNIGMIESVSKERVWSELTKILAGRNSREIISMMDSCGVFNTILPGISIKTDLKMTTSYLANLALVCRDDDRSADELVCGLGDFLRISKEESEVISFLHRCKEVDFDPSPESIRRFRVALPERIQKELLIYSSSLADLSEFINNIDLVSPLKAGNSPLIDGHALSKLTGLGPEKRLGRLKAWLHKKQIEDDLGTPEEVLSLLEAIDWENSDHEEWGALSWP